MTQPESTLNIDERARELEQHIQEAFGSLRYPGKHKVVYDTAPSNLDCADILHAFGGRHWSDIPSQVLTKNTMAYHYLTPEGYRFYLPAYLRAALKRENEMAGLRGDLITSLAPRRLKKGDPRIDPQSEKLFRERISLLTEPQKEVVREFLQWIRDAFDDAYIKEPALDPGGVWRKDGSS